MIKLITGKKGTGKTKILIDQINDAVKSTNGNLVCIEKGDNIRRSISFRVRWCDTESFAIEGADAFYGFVAGMLAGNYDIKDVCDKLCDKLIYRHPHIYGTTNVDGADQVLQNWEQLKLKEKGGNKRVLAGVPDALPSTIKAFRIQEKAAHVGFDWDTPEGALDKVKEEYAELKQEISAHDKEKAEQELGDLLFSIINVARLYKIHPDDALERTNKKFIRRFNYVEEAALSQNRQLKDMSLEEMDSLWNEAKAKGL